VNASWNRQGLTVAGFADGISSASLDGLYSPYDLLVDAAGNLHILDAGNNRIVYWPVNSIQGHVVAGNGAPGAGTCMIDGPSLFTGDSQDFHSCEWVHGCGCGCGCRLVLLIHAHPQMHTHSDTRTQLLLGTSTGPIRYEYAMLGTIVQVKKTTD
jgi:hypothetical protein